MKKFFAGLCLAALLLSGCTAATEPESGAPAQDAAPQEEEALVITQNPVATIELEDGQVIKAELYPKDAPNTVYNFIALANSGYYDGVVFHRAIADIFIQGGDPEGTGTGGPGYTIQGEFALNGVNNSLSHTAGVLSMARRTDFNSAGSQFFIMAGDYTGFDGQYAAFGKVTEGLDTVIALSHLETDENDLFVTQPVMKRVRVETFGTEYPEPEKYTN